MLCANEQTSTWNGLYLWCVYQWGRAQVGATQVYFYIKISSSAPSAISEVSSNLETCCGSGGSSPCCPTGPKMKSPHHRASGQHDNWGRLSVSRWLCKSLQHVFGVSACGVHQSATSQLHLKLSAGPITPWHRHPDLFSWKFIIYDTSSFLPLGTWMLLSFQSEIWLGSCYLSCFFEAFS